MASAYAQNMFSGFGAVPFPGSMAHLSAQPSQEAAPERSLQGGRGMLADVTAFNNRLAGVAPPGTARLARTRATPAEQGGAYARRVARHTKAAAQTRRLTRYPRRLRGGAINWDPLGVGDKIKASVAKTKQQFEDYGHQLEHTFASPENFGKAVVNEFTNPNSYGRMAAAYIPGPVGRAVSVANTVQKLAGGKGGRKRRGLRHPLTELEAMHMLRAVPRSYMR